MLAAIAFFSGQALAQTSQSTPAGQSIGPGSNRWSLSLTTQGYVIPHAEFFVSPTFTADRDWLHLEARYNDEDLYTGSLWIGRNLSIGRKLSLKATPMIGGIFGNTTGVAPGYEVSLDYKKLSFSTSGEYVFNTKNQGGSFFYSWPQITYAATGWLRVGLATQRTKAYHTSLDTQRGLLVCFSHGETQFTTYVFNAGWTRPTLVSKRNIAFNWSSLRRS